MQPLHSALHREAEGVKGPGCGPRAPVHPCLGSGPGKGKRSTLPSLGAGSGLFWEQIPGFCSG